MKPDVVGSWIFGVISLTLLVTLHWLAFRVGEKRRRARRSAQAHARGGTTISDGPITPK